MRIEIINPSERNDWDALLLRSDDHSFFHTSVWAKVLETTYRFKPLYFAQLEEDQINLLMPVMETRNLLNVKRGVSLPFTDFCKMHAQKKESFDEIVQSAIEYGEKQRWKYIEWRSEETFTKEKTPWREYYVHEIDLDKPETELFSTLKASTRRNIKKAAREGVTVNIDQSFSSLKHFKRLNFLTRKRHGLPPQPDSFFKNIFDSVISKDYGIVATAIYREKVIAASVFFHFGNHALYKYGASDTKHLILRPNNLIIWEAIKWYHQQGFTALNLGRTEPENHGLLQYKRSWGGKEKLLKYYRYDIRKKAFLQKSQRKNDLYTFFFARTPIAFLRLIGRLLYRHLG